MLGSISSAIPNQPAQSPEGLVFLKVISLERCENDLSFAERITRSTNFQNQIGERDFVALDEQRGTHRKSARFIRHYLPLQRCRRYACAGCNEFHS